MGHDGCSARRPASGVAKNCAPPNGEWPKAELVDERASLVLGQMMTDLRPGNARAAKVTGAMLLREFLTLRVAPLQARACPLWELDEAENKTRLRPRDLPGDELDAVMRLIVGDNQEYPPSAFVPLFQRRDREEFVASRLTFDARGLVPPVLSGALPAPKPVEVSSGESRGEGEEEEDSEETPKEVEETSPSSKADILCALPDDAEADAYQGGKEQPLVPTKGRSSLVDLGTASTPTPPAVGPQASQAKGGVPCGGPIGVSNFAWSVQVLVFFLTLAFG